MSSSTKSIFNLPQEVIFDILCRIPTKSILQFRCASASSVISDPFFPKLHHSSPAADAADAADQVVLIYYESTDYTTHFYSVRSPITLQETQKIDVPYKHVYGYLRIVGCSKGLVCFFDTNYYSNIGKVILWNPSFQRVKKIKNPEFIDGISGNFSHFVVGFGFDSRNLDFKVVKIVYDLDEESGYSVLVPDPSRDAWTRKIEPMSANSVLVYSLSNDSWKKIDSMAPCYMKRGWSSNVFVNGFVNWLAYKSETKPILDAIMAFDIVEESFRVMELPKNVVPRYDQVCLTDLMSGECLSLCFNYRVMNGERWDIWVMGEYGVADSWKTVCVVSQPALSMPLLLVRRDGEVLVVMNDGRLMLCDTMTGETRDLDTMGLPHSFCAISYTPSLALLNG